MRDLTSELTVFVIAIEKSHNYFQCLNAIENQTVKFQFKQVLNVQPMNEAFNQMIYQCETPYFVQIDEDMILNPNSIEIMYEKIKTSYSNIASCHFKLRDVFLDTIIGSAVIYNYDIIKNFLWRDVVACDNDQRERLKASGYSFALYNDIVGSHHPHWTIKSIFKRFCNKAEKEERFGLDKACLKILMFKLLKNYNKLNLFAFLGYITGLLIEGNRNSERNYYDYASEEFTKLSHAFAEINEIKDYVDFISPTPNAVMKSLVEHLPIEIETDIHKVKYSKKPILMWNPLSYIRNEKDIWKKELYDYCRETDRIIYTVERGALPDTIFIDKFGFLANSDSYKQSLWDVQINKEERFKIESYINCFINDYSSLEPQNKEELPEKGKETVIFVPLQVANDTVMLLWADWVVNLDNFCNIINGLALELPNVKFLVKNHPVSIGYKANIFSSSLPNIIVADDYHYKDCIAYSDAVLTINSGVGLQSMMWEKPTLICGKSFYQFNDINQKVSNYQDLKNIIEKKDFVYPDKAKVKRFIYYLTERYYSKCSLVKTGINSTKIEEFERIIYELPYSDQKVIINLQNNKVTTFDKLIYSNINFWLLRESCWQVVKEKNFNFNPLIIGVKDAETKQKVLAIDPNVQVSVNSLQPTKKMKIQDYEVKVPFPLVNYLKQYKRG